MQSAPAATRLVLHFLTPTAFRSQNRWQVLPDIVRVVESWRRTWQEAHPPTAPELSDGWADDVEVSGYVLRTESLPLKHGRFVGFVGRVEWRLLGSEADRRALCALAALANFGGTGAKTALGMGQTRAGEAE